MSVDIKIIGEHVNHSHSPLSFGHHVTKMAAQEDANLSEQDYAWLILCPMRLLKLKQVLD